MLRLFMKFVSNTDILIKYSSGIEHGNNQHNRTPNNSYSSKTQKQLASPERAVLYYQKI